MRKAVLLSKRTSARSQDSDAPPRTHVLRHTRAKKKDKGSTSQTEENPIVACSKCGALMWTSESTGTDRKTGEPTFTICCNHGQIRLPPINQPPTLLEELHQSRWFRDTIRVYNSVLAFTSVGMKMDYSVVHAPGPYTIRIQGQTHHRIGSLIPQQGCLPEYLQLYILIQATKLLPDKWKGKEYDLPSTSEVACFIVGDISSTIGIRDDHPPYMSLQYPLLFPYGEYGFDPEIPLHLEIGTSRTRQFLTVRQYHASQIQTRLNQGMTLIKGGRLLHQFVVDVYTAIEEDRLRWARNNQDVLRAKLYNNVLGAVSKGDTDAKIIGQRFILPPSFTGEPWYLVEKSHDAMAICREFGNPDLFITMTVNPNWREIKEHLGRFSQ
uniref:Helitron helicase-like domain-containing protein n=2 Tax=Brassica oleracea TaxID=3712 RepID=A0A0D3B901_BRAOL